MLNIDLSWYVDFDDFVYIEDKFYETYNTMLLDFPKRKKEKANATNSVSFSSHKNFRQKMPSSSVIGLECDLGIVAANQPINAFEVCDIASFSLCR